MLEELRELLNKVLLSQACLSDKIHDMKAVGDDVVDEEKKMKFWVKTEGILKRAITNIEKEWEKTGL